MTTPSEIKSSARILVVDDSRSARNLIKSVLLAEGYTVLEADDGKEAVKVFKNENPDMVLMDANMPVVDGFKSCSEIKRLPKGVYTRVIMITSQDDDATVNKAFSSGAEEFITKPINWGVLKKRMHLALENQAAQEEIREGKIRLDAIVNTAVDSIIVINDKGIIESFNRAAEKTFGYSTQEAIGQNVSLLMPSPYREKHDSYLAQYFETGVEKVIGHKREAVAQRKSGETFPIELSISRVRLKDRVIFTGIVRDITERKLAEEKIFFQANYDALTNLPNRAMFMRSLGESLVKAKQDKKSLGLIFIDLDRFKWINDNLGHAAGDHLLQVSAERLKSCVNEGDLVARLGGDEFTAILEGVDEAEVADIAREILNKLNDSFELEGKETYISGSLGMALFPWDAKTVEELLKFADEAMYRSKKAGRNAYHFYSGDSFIQPKKY
ncbi:MAG: diguanylate cyclase [Magnetococcales bacterium]|nr:diguanylate cyclase [Magnetococcales bacterium]